MQPGGTMESGVKFIRVRGKVVPIKADQVGGIKRKKVRESASDTVSGKDAAKSLRNTARKANSSGKIKSKASEFLNVAGFGLALGAFLPIKGISPALKRKLATGGLTVMGAGAFTEYSAAKDIGYAKQLRKDAGYLAKGKDLSKARVKGLGSNNARAYSSLFQSGMAQPTQPIVNPIKPGTTSI